MKKKIAGFIIFIVLAISFAGCTEQQRAKEFGGNATINLPPDVKLVTATWKQDSFWYLVRPMRANEEPESYTFIESSSFGIIEGKVLIVEKRR